MHDGYTAGKDRQFMGECSKVGETVSKTVWVGSIPAAYARPLCNCRFSEALQSVEPSSGLLIRLMKVTVNMRTVLNKTVQRPSIFYQLGHRLIAVVKIGRRVNSRIVSPASRIATRRLTHDRRRGLAHKGVIMDDTANQIKNIQEKIERKEKLLAELSASLAKDKQSLSKLQRAAKKTQPKPKEYITLDCQHNVGLYNKPCTSPYAKCALHNCLLSYWDIRSRKCVMKMCKHLEDIERVI